MRNIRQDELDLIQQWVKDGRVRDIRLMEFDEILGSFPPLSDPPVDSFPEPIGMTEEQYGNHKRRMESVTKINVRTTKELRVKYDPPEETIEQTKRMIDHLPEDNVCQVFSTQDYTRHCDILSGLVISPWARGFLKQIIREHEIILDHRRI